MTNVATFSPCEICQGTGFIYWGDENEYDVELCQCSDVQLNKNN